MLILPTLKYYESQSLKWEIKINWRGQKGYLAMKYLALWSSVLQNRFPKM